MEDSEDHPIEKQSQIYKREKLLGSGAYGRAFLVREVQTDTEWVIKQINLADLSPDQQETAEKQAKILQLLDHQNIVRFKEVYRTAKQKLNIVMQYAAGGDLSHRIRTAKDTNSPLPQDQILDWFIQICLGVKHIHDRKIIHRDIKAQNIFLTQDGMVKIGDFGVARMLASTAARARTVVGSPYYLSPEIIENRPYSYKTDIWSLGTLLFEMCALAPPFTANNLQFLALKIVQGTHAQLPKGYSDGMRSLVRWMLNTKESARPSIDQLLCSRHLAARIDRFLARSIPAMQKTLQAPPDLMNLEAMQNHSEVIQSKREEKEEGPSPMKLKAKTPQIVTKKGANNFFSRPMSGRRKEVNSDLADLIQIKPSLLQAHEKMERPVLPKVPKPPPKQQIRAKVVSPPSSAFAKKRPSYNNLEIARKELQPRPLISAIVRKSQIRKTQITLKDKLQKPMPKIQKQKPTPKPIIRKKAVNKSKKTSVDANKLEICSQQAKKKQVLEKKESSKKTDRSKKKQKPMRMTEEPIHPIMEEEKCNSELDFASNPSYYEQQSFESYSDGQLEESVELSLSDTFGSQPITPNYQKMLIELENIKQIVDNAHGTISNLPMFGQSIPELINFSSQIRQDDSDLESAQSLPSATEQQQLYLTCLRNHSELQSARMSLQAALGEANIIFAYHRIEQQMDKYQLDFDEDHLIRSIIRDKPDMDEPTLRKCFRRIVTILSIEKGL